MSLRTTAHLTIDGLEQMEVLLPSYMAALSFAERLMGLPSCVSKQVRLSCFIALSGWFQRA